MSVRKLRSGRYQARFPLPGGKLMPAPYTFQTKRDATSWIEGQRNAIMLGATWSDPRNGRESFSDYAERWLVARDLKARTRDTYRRILDTTLLPTFGAMPLRMITEDFVLAWYRKLDHSKSTTVAHAYSLLRTITRSAAAEKLIHQSPCTIPKAGKTSRKITIRPATFEQLETIYQNVDERYQLMVLLGCWCALRFGELAELRRSDIDLATRKIYVRRGVVRIKGARVVDTPKSTSGVRDVSIPPHVVPFVKAHLDEHVKRGKSALLFPSSRGTHSEHLSPETLYQTYNKAREIAGRPDLRFHDLRHTGATLAAISGATVKELMGRLGQSTPTMAMHYQHIAEGRDEVIANSLSAMFEAANATIKPSAQF